MVPRSKKPLKRRGSKDRLHVTNYFFQQGQTDKFKLVKNSRACERDGEVIRRRIKVGPDAGNPISEEAQEVKHLMKLIHLTVSNT